MYNRPMRRFWLSIVCGGAATAALAVITDLLAKYTSLDYLTSVLTYILIWPYLLWRAAFHSGRDIFPSDNVIIFIVACHVLTFSLLSYAFLTWRKLPRRLP
jgi:hypothetical protein